MDPTAGPTDPPQPPPGWVPIEQYGAGGPGGQGGYYPPPWAGPRPTNGFAIASLVCGFVCFPLAIVFGHVARRQIRMRNEDGGGLALAGLIVGYVQLAFFVLIICFAIAIPAFIVTHHTETFCSPCSSQFGFQPPDDQLQVEVSEMGAAELQYFNDHGAYTKSAAELVGPAFDPAGAGWTYVAGVGATDSFGKTGYCMVATSPASVSGLLDNDNGGVRETDFSSRQAAMNACSSAVTWGRPLVQ